MTRLYEPKPYQPLMTNFILDNPRCALWVPMGFGKSVATATAMDALLMSGESGPVLIEAPLRVARTTWPEEFTKWEHLAGYDVVPIIGSEEDRRRALNTDAQFYTANYETLPWLVDYLGERWPFKTFIADESTKLKSLRVSEQTSSKGNKFIRGQGGSRAKALSMIAHTKIKRFIELTGTFASNGLADTWGQMWFLDKGARLGKSFTDFSKRWFTKGYDGWSIEAREYAQEQIQELIRDIVLALEVKDWFDIDDPIVNDVFVDLGRSARTLYKQMEKDYFIKIENHEIEAFNAASKSMKLLQIANGAAYLDPEVEDDDNPKARAWREVHDEKLQALESVFNEAYGETFLIAYHFKSDAARILKRFKDARVIETEQDEADFKKGRIKKALVHPQSIGHGVDGFQNVCNRIVYFSQNWDLDLYQQLIERIGPVRQAQAGRDVPVYVTRILARDTIDEDVIERLDTKASVQSILKKAVKRRR